MDIPNTVTYNGRTYGVQSSGRYYQDYSHSGVPERLLHRRVWYDHNGPIPSGMHIHHKNDDWTDNRIENLEMLDASTHLSMHRQKELLDPKHMARLKKLAAIGRKFAPAWHASEEGRRWHSENAKKCAAKQPMGERTCEECGAKFMSKRKNRVVCSGRCYSRRGLKVAATKKRPAKCKVCGKDFMTAWHKPGATCSRTCRAKLGHNNRTKVT